MNDIAAADRDALEQLRQAARQCNLDLGGARVRRTSSRFCFGVEHGDYNGTELFGIGTDHFIWFAYKPSGSPRSRLFSGNFPDDGLVSFDPGHVPPPGAPENADTWARYAFGVEHILDSHHLPIREGIDGVLIGNIPGGGMSRSASLCINLLQAYLEVNGISLDNEFQIVELAQAVENVYVGSPCGQLDQIMILFAREGMGTHYIPQTREIRYVPLGADADDFRIVVLDTGTVRPGLEKSTYKVRRAECEAFAALLAESDYDIRCLADVREQNLYEDIIARFRATHPQHCARLKYIFHAQQRFGEMLAAWRAGDVATLGRIFRADGLGLRDDYAISGPELETMCDLVRTVPGVWGERMLGGGDKGAAGAIVSTDAVEPLRQVVATGYPRSRPDYADRYAVHVCRPVQGVHVLEERL